MPKRFVLPTKEPASRELSVSHVLPVVSRTVILATSLLARSNDYAIEAFTSSALISTLLPSTSILTPLIALTTDRSIQSLLDMDVLTERERQESPDSWTSVSSKASSLVESTWGFMASNETSSTALVRKTERSSIVSQRSFEYTQGTFPFLRLPAELRNHIYRLVFEQQKHVVIDVTSQTKYSWKSGYFGPFKKETDDETDEGEMIGEEIDCIRRPFDDGEEGLSGQLLCVNKQVYDEAMPVAMAANLFTMSDEHRRPFRSLYRFLRLLGSDKSQYLTKLGLAFSTDSKVQTFVIVNVATELLRCRNLRYLSFEVRPSTKSINKPCVDALGKLMYRLRQLSKLSVHVAFSTEAIRDVQKTFEIVRFSKLASLEVSGIIMKDNSFVPTVKKLAGALWGYKHIYQIKLCMTRIVKQTGRPKIVTNKPAQVRWQEIGDALGKYAELLESEETEDGNDLHTICITREGLQRVRQSMELETVSGNPKV